MSSSSGSHRNREEDLPEYGIRIPESEWTDEMWTIPDDPRTARTSRSRDESSQASAAGFGRGSDPAAAAAKARAFRRMGWGLSFACCMLGVLMVFGLAADAHPRWALLGIAPVAVGAAGLISVAFRLVPAFRAGEERRAARPRGSRWFWVPVVMALLGVGFFAVGYSVPRWMDSADQVLIRNHVVMWSELGFLCLLMAALAAGLIALALWTTPDDDDAILRRTDYAQRRRDRRRGSGDLYDSDWIRGNGPSER